MEVVDSARVLRQDELAAARAVLTAEQQVPFDQNVERLREEAEERVEQVRSRTRRTRP